MNTISQWGTYFYVGKVKKHQKVLDAFANILSDDSYFTQPWIYSNCKSSCQHPKNNQMPWDVYFDAIKPNVDEYLHSLSPITDYSLRCEEVWLNLYGKGGYQEIHDHAFPNRSFASSYILEWPGEGTGGELIFENTSFPVIQSTGINRIFEAFNYEKFIPKLEEGVIIIFPSWIKHYVLPNRSDKQRSTIAANFIIEGNYK